MLNSIHDTAVSEAVVGRRGWVLHSGPVVNPFRFHRDPLFLIGCAAYGLNRFWLKGHVHSAFLHSHFDDLWLIPCALPLLLWVHRRLRWRDDRPPTFLEVTSHLVVWSVLFEALGPRLMRHAIGDGWDVVCYWIGGGLAWLWWNRGNLLRSWVVA